MYGGKEEGEASSSSSNPTSPGTGVWRMSGWRGGGGREGPPVATEFAHVSIGGGLGWYYLPNTPGKWKGPPPPPIPIGGKSFPPPCVRARPDKTHTSLYKIRRSTTRCLNSLAFEITH